MAHSRLSRIDTQWSVIAQAHNSNGDCASALAILVDKYSPAIRKYLLASLRDEEAAAEVYQEFALKLVRGDFKNADSHKGRFRSMIKTALYRLMIDHHRKVKRDNKIKASDAVQDVPASIDLPNEDSFSISWRQSLLDQTWKRLEAIEVQTNKPYYSILRARVDSPKLTTRQLHRELEDSQVNTPELSSFRVFLHRARKRFAAILTELVRESIDEPTNEKVEQELIDLGLHHYCKG